MRNPAAKGRQDSNHKAIADAIRMLGYPVMDLSHAGNGVEDLLVGLSRLERDLERIRWWLVVEVKTSRNRRGEATDSQFTKAQREWREMTLHWPRLTVTSAQNAVDAIGALTR